MRMPALLLASAACLSALAPHAFAQTAAALSGSVTSAKEGAVEGVVVSARKDGSTITVSVISDDKGRFSFGGMSGGPIFKHVTEDDLEFVGMITEGIGPREQCLTEPGVVEETDGILVNGIPITKTILSRLLDHLPEKLLAVQPLRVLRRIHVVDKLPRSGDSDINGK